MVLGEQRTKGPTERLVNYRVSPTSDAPLASTATPGQISPSADILMGTLELESPKASSGHTCLGRATQSQVGQYRGILGSDTVGDWRAGALPRGLAHLSAPADTSQVGIGASATRASELSRKNKNLNLEVKSAGSSM